MWWWIVLIVLLAAIGYGLYRAARWSSSVEDDTHYLFEGGGRGSYGAKFIKIFGGRGNED
ncbi:MAG: hypothetical protein JWM76_3132 [Pseudonocardiales bacterium]|jgi:hypothetical protein|nr:hypothetical protein [Pseudonocardiales bacterium]